MTQVNGHRPSKPAHRWWLLPAGSRYPYPAGRVCARCAEPLSRYTPGPFCCRHEEHVPQEAVA
jgi:hypothetical protein